MNPYAAFRLICRLPHCRFDDDICTTAQAPLAAEGWPSGKQRQANRSITLPLCPPRQIADSWILFNLGAMPLSDKAKAALPLRAATLKQKAMITRQSGERQASLKPALHHLQLAVVPVVLHYMRPTWPVKGSWICTLEGWQLLTIWSSYLVSRSMRRTKTSVYLILGLNVEQVHHWDAVQSLPLSIHYQSF